MRKKITSKAKNILLFLSLLALLPSLAQSAESTSPKNPAQLSVVERIKALEMVSDQVAQDGELTFQLHKIAMLTAIAEARAELQNMNSNPLIQRCAAGDDRKSTCLMAWSETDKILQASFARNKVNGDENEFRKRPSQLSKYVTSAGVLEPCPSLDTRKNIISFLIDDHRIGKCFDLQGTIISAIGRSANAVISYSSITISTRALLKPMEAISLRPATEKVDVIAVLSAAFDSVGAELTAATTESLNPALTK